MSFRVEVITYTKGPDTLLKALFGRRAVLKEVKIWPSLAEQESWMSGHFEALKLMLILNTFSTNGGKYRYDYRVIEN